MADVAYMTETDKTTRVYKDKFFVFIFCVFDKIIRFIYEAYKV